MNARLFTALLFTTALGCATLGSGGGDTPPIDATIRVEGLRVDEREVLDEELCSMPNVVACRATRKGDPAEWEVRYQGRLSSLQQSLARIEQPGLQPVEQEVKLTFQGFDNVAPEIIILSPTSDTLTETKVEVVAEVPDRDVAEVRIDGKKARRSQGSLFKREVSLDEGPNEIVVEARDHDGNEASASVNVNVDTTPPDVDAVIKVVVEGHAEPGSAIFVDGRQVSTDLMGNWRVELQLRKGKRRVEIVAIDKHGNKTTEDRALFE